MSTLFIGYTRFSVHQYESGSFKATSAAGGFSEAEYTDWLYAPDRLDTRTAIFIEESLPQLEQASQKFDLVHIVAISPSLPEKYKTALQQARTRFPFLRIHETKQRAAPSHPNLQLVKTMLTKRGLAGQVFGMYRLDDDDLLPIDYFDRMTQYVTDEHVGYRVSLPQGIGAIRAQNGYVLPWTFYEAKSSAGFLTVHRFSPDGQKIYGLEARHHLKGHHKADRNFPVILDGRQPGFFRARHQTQDSTLTTSAGAFFTRVVEQATARAAATQDDVASSFPHIAERIFDSARPLPGQESLIGDPTLLKGGGIAITCDYRHPMLLSGTLESAPASSTIRLRLTLEESPDEKAVEFLREAGFTRDDQSRFERPLRWAGHQITDVLEPAPGAIITGLELSSSEDVTLASLFAAPLKTDREAS